MVEAVDQKPWMDHEGIASKVSHQVAHSLATFDAQELVSERLKA
jgi:hypothetical protein